MTKQRQLNKEVKVGYSRT